jgi:hypothetical protein
MRLIPASDMAGSALRPRSVESRVEAAGARR